MTAPLSQYLYIGGPGTVYFTQKTDYLGNSISNPTPAYLAVLQDHSDDLKKDNKSLYGDMNLSLAEMDGKIQNEIMVKVGTLDQIFANQLFWGQTVTTGSLSGVYQDRTAGTAIPATPFQITPTPPYSGTWARDLGVINVSNGARMTRVASSPAAGQYSVSAGVYTFSTADNSAGIYVQINFAYTASATNATTQDILPNVIGRGVVGTLDILEYDVTSASFRVKTYWNVKCLEIKSPAKQDDFMIHELKFKPFYAGGKYLTMSEFNA